ncbi:MAG: hypothetical protein Salg2KO_15800 [Salibacteraceae bacterium]
MPRIFTNTDLQSKLEKDGFVLTDFIDSDRVSRLKEFYVEGLSDLNDVGFTVGLDHHDKTLVKETTDFLIKMLKGSVEQVFQSVKIFTASYVVKHPGSQAIVPPHQDWTFTNESKFATYTVWIPLVDTTIENGALCVIPGSHKLFDHPRSSPSPQSKSAIADHLFTLFPYARPIPMKAGQALVFDNRTIHASPPNISGQPRFAVGIGVANEEAPLYHYFQLPNDPSKLKKYEVDEAFFIKFDNRTISELYNSGGEIEGYKELGTIQKNVPDLSGVEVESLIRSVEGNIWQEDIVRAIEPIRTLYQNQNSMTTENPDKETNELSSSKQEEVINQDAEPQPKQEEQQEWVDDRTFFEKYTIPNIIAEIRWRLTGKT